MKKISKKHKKALGLLDRTKNYSIQESVVKVKELAYARFDETVNAAVTLGIDPEKGEQAVRGSVVLPHQYREKIKILVFAKGDQAEKAKLAGADYVGAEDLVDRILTGWLDFNYAVATADLMGLVGKTAKILGPKGLLPNKKNGTVALDVVPVIKELQSGLLFFKNDKQGQVNFAFGKVSLDQSKLEENLFQFLKSLRSSKPQAAKGVFIKKLTINSTMGPGVPVDVGFLNN